MNEDTRFWGVVVFVALASAHCIYLFVDGWGHVVADWVRDRCRRG